MKNTIKFPMSEPHFKKQERDEVLKVLKSNWLSQGSITEKFEKNLSHYFNNYAVVVNNGSSALTCAFLAHGIKPGDNVVVPAFTFIASSSIPKMLGGNIIPCDIELDTLNIDLKCLEKILKKHDVKFVVAVDVGGLSVNINELNRLSKKYNFTLIEDAAEALGTLYAQRKTGSFSHTTIFSFHIAKQITTIEGGCITTGNKKIFEKLKKIRNHGRSNSGTYSHEILGSNFRITDVQSAIGLVQLQKIEKFLLHRKQLASIYEKNLPLKTQRITDRFYSHSYMLYFVISKNKKQKNQILNYLIKNGVDARNSWIPIHLQQCNSELKKYSCPNAEYVYDVSFTLPIHNSMKLKDAKTISNIFSKIPL